MRFFGNAAVADRRMGNVVKWYLETPEDINMRIPDVQKCVVYLGKDYGSEDRPKIEYRGTGFFVAKQSEKIPGASILFLVTAKHVADHLTSGKCYIRANTTDGKSANLLIPNSAKWHFHPTDAVADVAVLPVGMNPETFEFKTISTKTILTEKIRIDRGVGIGDAVYITGLFVYHQGLSKNIPILRTGNIAMTPDERIPVYRFGPMEAYLIEARSIGGLSGSPVFCIVRGEMKNGEIEASMFLMGLIHGHWHENAETVIDEIDQAAGIKAKMNVGIAIVTPGEKILDIINQGELAKMLDDYEASELAKNSPVPDSK